MYMHVPSLESSQQTREMPICVLFIRPVSMKSTAESPPPKPRAMGNFASHSHSHSRSIQSAEDRIAGHIGASGVAALRRVAECCCCCHRMQQEEQHSVLAEAMQVGHRFGNGKLSK